MMIGYARVSTADQNLDLQRDALAKAGVEQIFEDKLSGAKDAGDRPGLAAALSHCRNGDVLVVYSLSRLGRTTRGLVELLDGQNGLRERGIGFRSLTDGLDTTTINGRLLFTIMAAFAQAERETIVERTVAGLAAARARGRNGGRPHTLSPKKIEHARAILAADSTVSVGDAARTLGVSRATMYRALKG
jgi:DNA invertase Pin-like site-specific DNA recombinase